MCYTGSTLNRGDMTDIVAPTNQPDSDEIFLQQLEAVMEKMLPGLRASMMEELDAKLDKVKASIQPAAPATVTDTAKGKKSAENDRIAKLEAALRQSNINNLLYNAKIELGLDPELLSPLLATLKFDNDLVLEDGRGLGQYLSAFVETDLGKKYLIPETRQQVQGFNSGIQPVAQTKEFPYASLFQF